jgi:dTDP-4-dehydrorhamnose 3,5-epimerase
VLVEELSIAGSWLFTPILRADDRGLFLESFKSEVFEQAVGRSFGLQQMNISVSKRGTVRGVHFADVPPGQAKYVQCFDGAILDIVVDIRVGSPTFGQHHAITLTSDQRTALYISEGLGHAFCALTESATVGYLCNEGYSPTREHGINPIDPELTLPWPTHFELLLSPKDSAAPTFAEATASGLLPTFTNCQQL